MKSILFGIMLFSSQVFSTETIIHFNEGETLPFSLEVTGNVLSVGDESLELRVKEPFYLKILDDDLFFSKDQEEWKSFEDFFTGSFNATLRNLHLDLNMR